MGTIRPPGIVRAFGCGLQASELCQDVVLGRVSAYKDVASDLGQLAFPLTSAPDAVSAGYWCRLWSL